MGIEGLDYKIINIPLARGLKTKDDPRAMESPGLAICSDARWDDWGGIQTRFPFLPLGNSIFGGGTLSNVRRLEVVNDELVVFTDTQLYSWNAQLAKWVLRGTHLAVNITETPRFATTGDQINGDRAELNGTIVFVWMEGTQVYASAADKTTGSVLVPRTAVPAALSAPRVVALATKILLFAGSTASSLSVCAIDPASPGTGIAAGTLTLVSSSFNIAYDVVKVDGQDLAVGASRRGTATSYTAWTVSSALTVTAVVKARTCDGTIAVASVPGGGAQTQVIRQVTATAVQGDFLTTSTLADVTINQTIINGANPAARHITAAYRSTQTGGAFRCYVFAFGELPPSSDGTGVVVSNFVDTAGTIGSATTFARQLGIASRAFSYAGSVYVWLTFGGQSTISPVGPFAGPAFEAQDAYFLYRDDGFLVAKAVAGTAGGLNATSGFLPGVVTTGGNGLTFTWCAARRRRIDLGTSGAGFAARALVDVEFTFDSTDARRCAVIGRTLYVAAGEILQYDGVQLVEVGHHIYPWFLNVTDGPGGSVGAGIYAYKQTYRYTSGQNETDRSTTATVVAVNNTGSLLVVAPSTPLTVTHKTSVPPACEYWRTTVAPSSDSPFFLVSSIDPTVLSNPNRYIANDSTLTTLPTLNDALADSVATTKEANPENGSVLENISPPAASIIHATDTRVFLGGVAGDANSIWYSRLRAIGEIASFNDGLTIPVPPSGGDITALAYLNETLVVFRQTAIYALPGNGLDNTGNGQNFGPANRLSSDIGAVSAESVVLTPMGLMFKSRKGWYLLDRGWNTKYIGADVSKFDAETVNAAHVLEQGHQVRFVTSGRILVYDYLVDAWTSWSIADAVHATVWNGTYYYLSSGNNGPMAEQTTFASGVSYGLDVEIGSVKPGGLAGFVRIDKILITGEHRGTHALRIRTAFDYEQDAAGNAVYTDEVYWTPSPGVVGSPFQVSRGTSRGRCEAIKVRITAASTAKDGTPATTEAIKLTGLALKVGFRRATLNKRLPRAQKT